MIRVSSSAISAVGYDAATMRMKIQFTAGYTYDFCRVPESIFNGLLRASSKGTLLQRSHSRSLSVLSSKSKCHVVTVALGVLPKKGGQRHSFRRRALHSNSACLARKLIV